jgi:hypothetical protein
MEEYNCHQDEEAKNEIGYYTKTTKVSKRRKVEKPEKRADPKCSICG